MTKKRFMVDDAGTLIDMETRNMYELAYEVVDLLNELNDENEELQIKIADLRYENKNLKPNLNSCRRERKQIKQTIKEAYETERTQIGQSVLKQLLEAIQ